MPQHYIITNREITKSGNQKDFYKVNDHEYLRIDGSEEARDEVRYGTVTFDDNKKTKFQIDIYEDPGDKVMEDYLTYDDRPERPPLGSEKVFQDLYQQGTKADQREDILVYVHGFKADLDTALDTMKELHDRYVKNSDSPIKHIVLFTWPARKKLLKYRDDARDAKLSGYALARSLSKLKDLYRKYFVNEKYKMCEQKIHLMCHSMGNRVLESMFQEIIYMKGQINNLCGEIFLMGADVDYDALEEPRPLSRVIDLGERVHIYYHNNDEALGISELTKNAFNRLGRWGAKHSSKLPDDVYQSDVSYIQDEESIMDKLVHHWYYISSQSVVDDVIDVLNGKNSVFSADF